MLNRRFISLGKGLLAVSLLLGALHAEPPPESNPAIDIPTEPVPSSAPESFEPHPPDPTDPIQEPVTPILQDPVPIDAPPVTVPTAEHPERTADTAELSDSETAEQTSEAEQALQPEEDAAPVDEPVSSELERIETGPPPLRHEDLEAVATRLAAIEENLAGQQQRALELVVSSNRTALIVAGVFAGVGVLAILIAALVLGRILNRFSDVMLTLPAVQPVGRAPAIPWPGHEELHPSASTAIEHVSARFLGAIEQLEQRIRELERLPQSQPRRGEPGNGARQHTPILTGTTLEPETPAPGASAALDAAIDEPPESAATISNRANERHRRVEELLVEGENLLQSDGLDEALERFEDALALEPRNADALIKRGMALERLQRMEAALESYDRAIASNGSLTLAYLHKGAVCNRLQRYREALECYERALQTEHKS